MNRKRPILLCNAYQTKRKKLSAIELNDACGQSVDIMGALSVLKTLFPVEKFQRHLPPIVMKHQLYAFVPNRTDVDRQLNEMRKSGQIRVFKLGNNEDELAIVFLEDYLQHIERCSRGNSVVANFISNVVTKCPDISYSKDILLKQYSVKEEHIRELIQHGVLTSRDVGCYWLSIPQVGEFVKSFLFGRRATLQYVRRTKYKEILQADLEQRKLPRKALLGILYHIYDLIGADLVKQVDTSSGKMLRLQIETQNR